jgi:hypothetical protein
MKLTLLWASCFVVGLMTTSAHAATWTVTTTGSGGTCTSGSTTDANCTLGAAITAAGNGDTILFAPAVQTQTIPFIGQNVTASITIDGSPNGVALDGGGNNFIFYVDTGPTVQLSHLTFQHGLGTADGGAIYINNGNVTVDSCTFANNSAAIGGAIFFSYGSLTVLNSTFFNNQSPSGPSSGFGGAIASYGPTLTIANSTIAGNSAAVAGGGVDVVPGSTVFLLSNIIATNTSASGPDIVSYTTTVTSLGSNLIGDNSGDAGYVSDPSDQIGVDPRFSPAGLAGNGGATQTVALLSSSPAVRQGNCAGHVGTPTIPAAVLDQRGIVRGAPCAIGAYDATVIFYDGFEN